MSSFAASEMMSMEPCVMGEMGPLRGTVPHMPGVDPIVRVTAVRAPDPSCNIGLVVATVKRIGSATKRQVVDRSGLASNAVAILLPAAVEVGLLVREVRGMRHVYRVAPVVRRGTR